VALSYRKSEKNGLSFDGSKLIVAANGKKVASAPFTGDFGQALRSFEALRFFPKLDFTLSGEEVEYRVAVSCDAPVGGMAMGKLKVNDVTGSWSAGRRGNTVFLLNVPGREFVQDQPGMGWEITLPRMVLDLDPVVVQRVGLMIEELIYRLAQGTIDAPAFKRKVNNVFSATNQTWAAPLPLLKGRT